LREAIAQLMEYAYYIDAKGKCVTEMVVISPNKLKKAEKVYLKYLRANFGLPIFHQRFDLERKNSLDVKD
jgi:hypothetical protein